MTRTPYQLTSGPLVHYFNHSHEYISSLEEAKELALDQQHGEPGMETYIEVSWGVQTVLRQVKDI